MKKIYKHEGPGHYIGSCIIVIAEDEYEASDLIRTELDSMGLHNEVINMVEMSIKKQKIIYAYDGDY